MFCYVDESGNTGANLFDAAQPILYYGLITSATNLDITARGLIFNARKQLDVEFIHAKDLGVKRLSKIAGTLRKFSLKRDVRFSIFSISKPDHAIIMFFDQVFDSGINKAVPWNHYWTPLRYILIFKVAYLFDESLAKDAWKARQERNPARAADDLKRICKILLSRVGRIPDERSREIISGALLWASKFPYEIDYGVGNKDSALQISPNLIGFQQVLQCIAIQSKKQSRQVLKITVDRQTQFNQAQGELADIYCKLRGHKIRLGAGMPELDMTNMPEVPPVFCPSNESPGLELVDVVLWVAKRRLERKALSPELEKMFNAFTKRGLIDEISLRGLERRWNFLLELPDPDKPLPDELVAKIAEWERDRILAVESCYRDHSSPADGGADGGV